MGAMDPPGTPEMKVWIFFFFFSQPVVFCDFRVLPPAPASLAHLCVCVLVSPCFPSHMAAVPLDLSFIPSKTHFNEDAIASYIVGAQNYRKGCRQLCVQGGCSSPWRHIPLLSSCQ